MVMSPEAARPRRAHDCALLPPAFMPRLTLVAVASLLLVAGSPAWAQIPGFSVSKQFRLERLGDKHWRATGQVEMAKDDQQFFADVVDFYTDEERLVATGNVVFVSTDSRIAADRVEFNTRDRTGTFYNAAGTATIGARGEPSMFGTKEPDAYFYGETIEKLGPSKYRITRGAFTTCVQPTPRWELVTSSAVITVDEYVMLKNTVLKVKGVPLFYLPVLYYPMQEDDRSTGFLIPAYGNSTIRGQTLSNAFFWAISRSQDATFFHDWFSKTGQGLGGEYRYVAAPGSEGFFRTYWLNEHETTFTDGAGNVTSVPGRRSYEIRAAVSQGLPWRLRARGNIDYFSDVAVQQLYHNNFYDATRRQRSYGGNVAGTWGANSLSATYNTSEVFYGTSDSTVYGSTPRVAFTRAPRRFGASPAYYSFNGLFGKVARVNRFEGLESDQGVTRFDLNPSVRLPFTRFPFLTVNSSVSWRGTYYSRSQDEFGALIDESLFRGYFDMRADVVGPVFTRIFDTPDNGYAEKYKHLVEPSASISWVSPIDTYDQIIKLESDDYTIGGALRLNYGLTNRVLARLRGNRQAREFLNVGVFQTYYTDAEASRFDPAYGSSYGGREASKFSPVLLNVRANPTDRTNGTFRLEYDYATRALLTVRAGGGAGITKWVDVNGGWSRRRFIAFDRTDNFLNLGGTVRAPSGRIGGTYGLDYDFFRGELVQQRVVAYYNAQCCGVAVEYQTWNFGQFGPGAITPQDRRFNISFTLAGVGTFSNFFGALGGQSGRSY